MEKWYPVVWLVLAVVLAGAEAATVQLISIWFALGAVAALLVSVTGVPFAVQFSVFVLVSCVALLLSRPLAKKLAAQKKVRTNADVVIGMTGIVCEAIDNADSAGRVLVNGLTWTARSNTGEPIPDRASVRVLRIDGVKLIVEPESAKA